MKLLKKVCAIFFCAVLLFSFGQSSAQSSPPMSVNVPESIQVNVSESFSIPVTIVAGSAGLSNVFVWAIPDSGQVSVNSPPVVHEVYASASTRLVLTGRAVSPGHYRVRIEASANNNIAVLATSEVVLEVVDPAAQTARPRFSIPGVVFIPEKPDLAQPFTVNIELRNIGNASAHELVATMDGGKNFAVTTLTNRVHLPLVERGAAATVSFRLLARDSQESNEITLILNYGAHTQTEILNLPLPNVRESARQREPLLRTVSSLVLPEQSGRFVLRLTVQNAGETEAKNIKVSLDGGDLVFPSGGGNTRNITSLAPGAAVIVEYLLNSRGEVFNHPVNLVYDFFDSSGEELKSSERIFISANFEPAIRIAAFNVSPGGESGEFRLNMQFKNSGFSAARNISVRFIGTQAFPLEGSSLLHLPELAAGATGRLSLLMKAATQSELYSIPVEITYRSIGGAEHKINDTITLAAESIGVNLPQEQTPRVMLEKHSLSTDQVLAGSSFKLTLNIKNNADRAVGNLKISLGNIQVGGGAGEAGRAGGTVFSTLDGSSSSFFVDRIAANSRLIKEVALFVDPNAAAMTYSLPITIEYEDDAGKAFSVNEAVNIPVLQESRIQVLSREIPEIAMAGQAVPISMEFANTGRVALNNVLVFIEGDFPKENATYFIPRLEIGASDFFQGMIIPDAQGTLSGNLVIVFLDGHNQEVRIDYPFTVDVQPMEQMPAEFPTVPVPEQGVVGFAAARVTLWGGVAIIIAATVIILRKIRAKRRKSIFDEQI